MAPAEGELNLVGTAKSVVAGIAVDLEHAGEAPEVLGGSLAFPVGRIDVGDCGWIGAAPRSVVAGVSPELAGLGPAASRLEHRRSGLVGEQPGAALQVGEEMIA